jgi:hypothetical protein
VTIEGILYWLLYVFIDHLYTRLGTASNYSTIGNLHNSQIIIAPAKHVLACWVFTSRSKVTASDSGDSSASRAQVLSLQAPAQNWLGRPNFLQDNTSERTT